MVLGYLHDRYRINFSVVRREETLPCLKGQKILKPEQKFEIITDGLDYETTPSKYLECKRHSWLGGLECLKCGVAK